MGILSADFSSEYSIRRALREEGKFSESVIREVMEKLFPTKGTADDDETGEWKPDRSPYFEPSVADAFVDDPDATQEWPAPPPPADAPYEPSEADLRDYSAWSRAVEAQWDRDLELADSIGSPELRLAIEDAKERMVYERGCNARFA